MRQLEGPGTPASRVTDSTRSLVPGGHAHLQYSTRTTPPCPQTPRCHSRSDPHSRTLAASIPASALQTLTRPREPNAQVSRPTAPTCNFSNFFLRLFFLSFDLVWCGVVGPRRGLGSEASLRRRRGPARLWVAVAALVVGTVCLCSSSSVGLFGASYKVQVRSPRPRLPFGVCILLCSPSAVCTAWRGCEGRDGIARGYPFPVRSQAIWELLHWLSLDACYIVFRSCLKPH